MTSEEREKLEVLCQQISEEKNPERFDDLVIALNELLDLQNHRACLQQ